MFLDFEGIENVRDLGGLLRADGAKVKPGVLLRTGRLQEATDADVARLRDMGLWAIVDFRDDGEILRSPDREVPGAAYYHYQALPPLSENFKPVNDPSYTVAEIHEDFRRLYRFLAQSNEAQEAYTEFFRVLLASEGKPVLWHCTQGKDRTGVAALLLLTALGIDEETITREYMQTNEFMQKILDSFAAMENPPIPMEAAREVFWVFSENITMYRHCLEIEYGSVMNYLELALGVGPDEIEKLENYYLEW